MTNDRYRQNGSDRRTADKAMSRVLPATADVSNGFSNLATQPRAGNISTDTRAGSAR